MNKRQTNNESDAPVNQSKLDNSPEILENLNLKNHSKDAETSVPAIHSHEDATGPSEYESSQEEAGSAKHSSGTTHEKSSSQIHKKDEKKFNSDHVEREQ